VAASYQGPSQDCCLIGLQQLAVEFVCITVAEADVPGGEGVTVEVAAAAACTHTGIHDIESQLLNIDFWASINSIKHCHDYIKVLMLKPAGTWLHYVCACSDSCSTTCWTSAAVMILGAKMLKSGQCVLTMQAVAQAATQIIPLLRHVDAGHDVAETTGITIPVVW